MGFLLYGLCFVENVFHEFGVPEGVATGGQERFFAQEGGYESLGLEEKGPANGWMEPGFLEGVAVFPVEGDGCGGLAVEGGWGVHGNSALFKNEVGFFFPFVRNGRGTAQANEDVS